VSAGPGDVAAAPGTDSVAAMRRTLITLAALSLPLVGVACSSDGDATTDDTGATDISSSTEGSDDATDATSDDGSTSGSTPATGSAGDDDADCVRATPDPTDTTVPDSTPPTTNPEVNPDKPEVSIPDDAPTELTVTVLDEGDGPAAATGDTVVVNYVGVRSSDGVEFDNSWDRYEPFPIVLGSGSVITGWEEGLVGVEEGARVQLDIPSDLAYGAEARGDLIGPNEDLTFVIDVEAVIQQPDPADAPTEAGVDASDCAQEVSSVDLIEGDGTELEAGQTAVLNLVLFRGDNLVQLDSTWGSAPIEIPMDETGFPGLVEAMPGMKVGGRRAVTIPPELGFGPDGNPTMGLPRNTDIVVVVDLVGAY
jgi:peptidylprolyl isomerase